MAGANMRSRWTEYVLFMLGLSTHVFGHSPNLTARLFGDCPQLSANLQDAVSQLHMSASYDYQSSQITTCSNGSLLLPDSFFDIEKAMGNAAKLRCTALSGCSPDITAHLQRLIHKQHRFDHCQLVVVTAVYKGYDILPPAPSTRFPNITCFIAFLDTETEALHSRYLFGGQINGWIALDVPMTGITDNSCVKARLWKHLLPQLFPLVRWSIWTDSKIKIRQVCAAAGCCFIFKDGAAVCPEKPT